MATTKTTKKQSAKAWIDLLDRGIVRGQWGEILSAMIDAGGPRTAAELAKAAHLERSGHKRVSELVRAGYVVEATPGTCSVTGRESTTWRLVDSPPDHPVGVRGVVSIADLIGRVDHRPGRKKPKDAKETSSTPALQAEIERLKKLAGEDEEDGRTYLDCVVEAAVDHAIRALAVDPAQLDHYEGEDGHVVALGHELGSVFEAAGVADDTGRSLLPALKEKAAKVDALARELAVTKAALTEKSRAARETVGFAFTVEELRATLEDARGVVGVGAADHVLDDVVRRAVEKKAAALAEKSKGLPALVGLLRMIQAWAS